MYTFVHYNIFITRQSWTDERHGSENMGAVSNFPVNTGLICWSVWELMGRYTLKQLALIESYISIGAAFIHKQYINTYIRTLHVNIYFTAIKHIPCRREFMCFIIYNTVKKQLLIINSGQYFIIWNVRYKYCNITLPHIQKEYVVFHIQFLDIALRKKNICSTWT